MEKYPSSISGNNFPINGDNIYHYFQYHYNNSQAKSDLAYPPAAYYGGYSDYGKYSPTSHSSSHANPLISSYHHHQHQHHHSSLISPNSSLSSASPNLSTSSTSSISSSTSPLSVSSTPQSTFSKMNFFFPTPPNEPSDSYIQSSKDQSYYSRKKHLNFLKTQFNYFLNHYFQFSKRIIKKREQQRGSERDNTYQIKETNEDSVH